MRWRMAVVITAVGLGALACGDTEPLTLDQCRALGGQPVLDPGDGSVHEEGCPDGQARLGPLDFGIEGGLCCRGALP